MWFIAKVSQTQTQEAAPVQIKQEPAPGSSSPLTAEQTQMDTDIIKEEKKEVSRLSPPFLNRIAQNVFFFEFS